MATWLDESVPDWEERPRGTSCLDIGGYELSVWKVSGEGWIWTVRGPDGKYIGTRGGFETKAAAQHEALTVAEADQRAAGK